MNRSKGQSYGLPTPLIDVGPVGESLVKRCTKCNRRFPETPEYFCLDKRNKSGLAAHCRDCDRERNLFYMRKRREQDPSLSATYYAKNKARECRRLKTWQEQNPEKARERLVRYRKNNPDKRRAGESRRRAQKRKTRGLLTADDIKVQYKRQKGRCYYCGEKVGKDHHIDHLIPLSRGGLDTPENIVISCPSCNLSKGNKLPREWVAGGRLL